MSVEICEVGVCYSFGVGQLPVSLSITISNNADAHPKLIYDKIMTGNFSSYIDDIIIYSDITPEWLVWFIPRMITQGSTVTVVSRINNAGLLNTPCNSVKVFYEDAVTPNAVRLLQSLDERRDAVIFSTDSTEILAHNIFVLNKGEKKFEVFYDTDRLSQNLCLINPTFRFVRPYIQPLQHKDNKNVQKIQA